MKVTIRDRKVTAPEGTEGIEVVVTDPEDQPAPVKRILVIEDDEDDIRQGRSRAAKYQEGGGMRVTP